jgi:hypothetical protein
VPGEVRGSSSGATVGSLSAKPGQYQLHFVCDGPPRAGLSLATWAGAEVLARTQVPCNGHVFEAPVLLPTEGVDLTMSQGGGVDGRFAYRLVPTGQR